MGEGARGLVELALAGAVHLSAEAREQALAWLAGATPEDLQLLLDYAVRRARRGRRTPSGTLEAVRQQLEPAELEVLRERVAELEAERDLLKKQLRRQLRKDSDAR